MAEPEVSHPVSGPNFKNLLNPVALRDIVAGWLKEDVPNFDYGAFVVGEKQETAVLLCKSAGVLAGVPFFNAIFEHLDCHVSWNYLEGVALHPICQVATVTGKAKNILLGERVALNCISRASGVATAASRLRVIAEKAEWHGEIAATRKTTPGFRMVEKYSVLVGGLSQHRYDLSSMVMLKDNHIWSAGSITQAVKEARRVCGFSMKIEVECLDITDALEAARAGADIVMLDNVGPQKLHEDAACLKAELPRLCVEASGGVTEDNVRRYMGPHVDVISLGRLTQGYECVDFSLKVVNENTKSPHLRTTV